jgi:hypothetical protein
MNTALRIGNRVELINCTRCQPGTVTGFSRNRVELELDDEPNVRWLLRAESLRLVATAATSSEQARQAKGPHATG